MGSRWYVAAGTLTELFRRAAAEMLLHKDAVIASTPREDDLGQWVVDLEVNHAPWPPSDHLTDAIAYGLGVQRVNIADFLRTPTASEIMVREMQDRCAARRERALQEQCDEEGCGAAIGAMMAER